MTSSFPLLLLAAATLSHGPDGPPCSEPPFPSGAGRWERGGAIIAPDSPLHPDVLTGRKRAGPATVVAPVPRDIRWPIIDLSVLRNRPLPQYLAGEVKVLDVFDDGHILLGFGTRQGVRKGDQVFLHSTSPAAPQLACSLVELTQVGEQYSVARPGYGLYGLQAWQIDKDNQVRKEDLRWILVRDPPKQKTNP